MARIKPYRLKKWTKKAEIEALMEGRELTETEKKKSVRISRHAAGYLGHLLTDYRHLFRLIFGEENEKPEHPLWFIRGKNKNLVITPRGEIRAFIVTLYKIIRYSDYLTSRNPRKDYTHFNGGKTIARRFRTEEVLTYRVISYRRKLKHFCYVEYIRRKYPDVKITSPLIGVLSDVLDEPFYLLYWGYMGYRYVKGKKATPGTMKGKCIRMSDEQILNTIGEEWAKRIDTLLAENRHPKIRL